MIDLRVEVHPDDPLHQRSGSAMAWTLGNTSEALPGVLTPLGWTFWRDHLNIAIRRAYYRLGALPRRELQPNSDPLENFGAAFYGRYTASIELGRRMANLLPGTNAASFDRAMFGSVQPGTPARNSVARYPIIAGRLPTQVATVRRRSLHNARDVLSWWHDAAFRAQPWPEGLAQHRIREAGTRFESVMADHTMVTYLAQLAVTRLRSAAGNADVDLGDLMASGSGTVVEAAMLTDLRDLAGGLLTMDQFLSRHGFYCPRGGAIDIASWRESPEGLAAYRIGLSNAGGDSPDAVLHRRATRGEEAAQAFLRSVPAAQRIRARAAIAMCRAFVPFREVGKASFLQVLDVVRAAARDRGAALAQTGVLASEQDIFFLTEQEFLAHDLRTDIKDIVAFRRERRDHYLQCELPRSWTGDPEPLPAGGDDQASEGVTRQGTGVSAGAVEGTVRVITAPDADDFDPDEVLVCVSTDPAWAPLLYMAAGLVTELGGMLSHGAIIARELGLPAVVNVTQATSWLRTGDVVRIDGASGDVSILSRA